MLTETHRSKVGVFGLVGVVIQSDEVEPRLDLITAATKHVVSAHALTAHLVTPEHKQEGEMSAKEPENFEK